MKVDVRDILKINGASLNIEFNEKIDSLNSIDPEIRFDKPVVFNGRLVNVTGVLKLDGKLKAEYNTRCYRCLKELDGELNLTIREDFVNAVNNTDTEAYTYDANQINLDKVLEDNIILNLPMKTVCSDICKGLCPVCGVDLNINQCNCKVEDTDPRLEGLKKFFQS